MVADYNLGTARGRVDIDTGDVANASKELKNADIVLNQAGHSMIQFGQQAIAGFGYVIGIAAKFEKEMDFVQAVTNGSADDMERLKQKAIELGKSGPFGPNELAASFVELAKAGVTTEELINGVADSVVNLAGAADISATEAGDIIVQTMSIFQLAAEEVPRATDIIAGAANASMIDVSDFATSLKYAGPVAEGLGVDLEDLATTIALLGQSGIKGSTAGTSLRQVMLNLSGATPKATDRMKELGIITEDGSNQFYDAAGNVKSLSEVFDILNTSMKGLTERQKGDALRDIFGVRQLPTVLFLMEQGKDAFAAMNEEINKVTAADVASKRLDNLSGSVRKFKATLDSVLLGPGSEFQGMLKNIVDAGREALIMFDELPGPVKKFLLGAVGAVGVLALLSGGFLVTIGTIVRAVRVFAEIATVFGRIGPLIKSVATAMKALNFAFLTSPVFWIIVAIIALAVAIYLLWTRSERFRNGVKKLWAEMKKLGQVIWNFIKKVPGWFENAWNKAKDAVVNAWEAVKNAVSTGVDAVVNFFKELPGKVSSALSGFAEKVIEKFIDIKNKVWDAIKVIPGMAKEAFGKFVDKALEFLKDLPRNIGFILGFAIGKFIRYNIDLVKNAVKYGNMVLKATIKWLGNLFINTVKFLSKILVSLIKWGVRMVAEAAKAAWKLYWAYLNFLVSLPGRFLDILNQMLQFLIDAVPKFFQWAWNLGNSVVSAIWGFLMGLPGLVWDTFIDALNSIISTNGSFFSAAWDIGNAILDGIIDLITGLPGLVWNILNDVINTFKDMVKTAFNAARDFASGLWDGFKEGLGINSPSFIEEAMFDIQDESDSTAKLLSRTVRQMGLDGNRMVASVNSGALGLSRPMALPAGAVGSTWNQNAPLVGQATIRSNQDIYDLARQLKRQEDKKKRARGLTSVG